MNNNNQSLLDAALALPEVERAELAERLLESLAPDADEMEEREFVAELERRSAEFDRGTADAIPWTELRKEDGA